jgi:ribulose-5-phosphate 4-epimerase/fuculose-1-phosphate aldolase
MGKGKVSDLTRAYPELAPDRDYPPLRFRSLEASVSAAEWEARVDCACAYRLVRHFGMDDLIYNHISARIPGTEEFLLNPMGLMYDEICASALIKVDLAASVLWQPEFPQGLDYKFNPAGFVIHGAIHQAKPELHCVIHTHSLAGMAVSSLKQGLLPMTQTAMRFARVAYHDYEGVVLEMDERKRLVANLGDAEVMFLRNHGLLAVGETVAEAFNNNYR